MADIRIKSEHSLGLARARDVTSTWAWKANEEYEVKCSFQAGGGDGTERLKFHRSGVSSPRKQQALNNSAALGAVP